MVSNQVNFDKIFKITQGLLQTQDLDILLEHVLTEIRSLVNADAGSIYLVEGTNLRFSYTQNNTLQKKLSFGKKLIYSTFTVPIDNKSIAGYVANTGILVNIPDAYRIDNLQPYSFDKKFDETTSYRTQSMLSVPIKTYTEKVIGVIQLINSLGLDNLIRPFTTNEETMVQFFANSVAIAIEHAQMLRSIISCINKMTQLHDPNETAQHNNRIAAYAAEIYEAWAHKKGVPEREIQHNRDVLRTAAMLHDVGKIAIPTTILNKTKDDLTSEELKILHRAPIYGTRLFPNTYFSFEEIAQSIALNQHENWDGSGYPGHVHLEDGLPLPGYDKTDGTAFGKRGTEIPIYARIVAVACAYDKLIHPGPAKENPDKNTALNTILELSGKQFDPDVVSALVNCIDMVNAISVRYGDN